MTTQSTTLLLTIFAIHFAAFLMLYFKRKERILLGFSSIFVLLIISTSLRKWFPELAVGGILLFWPFRITGWIMTALCILLRFKRK